VRLWRWWRRRRAAASAEVHAARQRLEATSRDDAQIDLVMGRVEQALRENNLAPYVMRALGITRRQ